MKDEHDGTTRGEYDYIVPAGYSDSDWDALTHTQRMVALQNAAVDVKSIPVLKAIRDELRYYASIKDQMRSFMRACRIADPDSRKVYE